MTQTLLHLSDLHFDHVEREVLEPLVRFAHDLRPDHVVVSGDLTQRARRAELVHARAFLDRLPQPLLVVPGNHDIPLYDVLARLFRPRAGYRRHVSRVTQPLQRGEGACILGLDTSRAWRFKEGSVNRAQIDLVRRSFAGVSPDTLKVVATHHPFDPPPEEPHHRVVGNAREAMRAMLDARVDLVLSGHLHRSRASHSAHRFEMQGHSAVLVQAGTATSTRTRGEENSFNVIRAGGGEMTIERRTWSDASRAFTPTDVDVFRRTATGWARVEPSPRSGDHAAAS
jgi:3',5'-cyclic AMP phosphodiesterase CpdA